MKKKLAIRVIIISVFIMLSNAICIQASTPTPTPNNTIDMGKPEVSNYINGAIALITLLNLVVVIGFFIFENRARKKDEKISRRAFWYRNVIIEKNLTYFSEFVIDSKNKFDHLYDLDSAAFTRSLCRNEIADIKKLKQKFIWSFNDLIRVIDNDTGANLDSLVLQFEDDLTLLIESLQLNRDSYLEKTKINLDFDNKIFDFRNKFLSTIYTFDLNGYK